MGEMSAEQADAWARRFELLSDTSRLRLLMHMHWFPGSPVGELAEAAGLTPTAASQALRVLREQGWVASEREGRIMRYRLVDETAHSLLHFMGAGHVPGDPAPAAHAPGAPSSPGASGVPGAPSAR